MVSAVLYEADCLDVLPLLDDASIDAVVTDPPYHLTSIVKRFGGESAAPAKSKQTGAFARASRGFMGKTWDGGDIAFRPELWAEVLRVLKPGGHCVAFSGTRTYHRMACAIEDAGFEIRDQAAWCYGSGFPKSHDVSKGIQKRRAEDREPQKAVGAWLRAARERAGLRQKDVAVLWPSATGGLTGCVANWELGLGFPSIEQWGQLKARIGFGDEQDAEVWRLNGRKGSPGAAWSNAEIVGEREGATPGFVGMRFSDNDRSIRAVSAEAEAWAGWGTALKPAWEPICIARKPLIGTVAENVLAHGVGALNIDGCRIGDSGARNNGRAAGTKGIYGEFGATERVDYGKGRWPANFIHDGSDEVLAAFPGGSARFFYSAKASRADRADRGDGNNHPTVKPTALMQWLCRMVTPPGGTVLDPFVGSGSTGRAAAAEGFGFVGIERDPAYAAIARRRMGLAPAEPTLEEMLA